MGRHMLHQSPVGFSLVPAPVCIDLGAVVCNLLCPYVIGKQTNSRLFAPHLVPVGVPRSRGEEECHQAVAVSLLQAVFTVDVVFMKALPEAGTQSQSPACEGEKAGFVSDASSHLPQSAHSKTGHSEVNSITRMLQSFSNRGDVSRAGACTWSYVEKSSLAEGVRAQGPSISTTLLVSSSLPEQSLLRIGV